VQIAIAADHNGLELKAHLIAWLTERDHTVEDLGSHDTEVVDYPVLCEAVGARVVGGQAEFGIVVGGSGQGEAIACNKLRGIRAALCHSLFATEIARAHNAANILVIGAKVVTPRLAEDIATIWLTTPFKGGRHQDRVDQITALERGESLL
jgi:ribose 5-phosphate isomerase B